jgi:hypothetical protein
MRLSPTLAFQFFCREQATTFWNKILGKIKTGINMHSSRSLSVLGRATVVNALILSRLWHLVWVTPFPSSFLSKIRQAITRFVCAFKPTASWTVITTPRYNGGLGVIDPFKQQQTFNIKHLCNATGTTASWRKDIVLDLLRWKTKSTHRLAFMLNPQETDYTNN